MRTIVAGNWKMNKDAAEVSATIDELKAQQLELPIGVEVIIAPAFPFLAQAVELTARTPFAVAAQNCHQASSGAFTGEVSTAMLKSIGVRYCIVGHSERRQFFNETDPIVGAKMKALLAAGITPIYCCGEQREQRAAEAHFEHVGKQLATAFEELSTREQEACIVAYEPVWAIGTGLNATSDQAQEMHAFIRDQMGVAGAHIPILYGGSCKPSNAAALFACKDVNGGLVGGASLNAGELLELVQIASDLRTDQD